MEDHLLTALNTQQRAAVEHPLDIPAMVIAGAGSGKTRVLTTRVAYLIAHYGVDPTSILLVTFTNKAAQEMLARVEQLTGKTLPFSGTFHRFCARVLRRHGAVLGLSPRFAIFDEDDQMSLMSEIIKDQGYALKEVKPRVILAMISEAKNALLTPAEYRATARGKYQEIAAVLYPLYQKRLLQSDAVDFDDLLVKVVELLREYPEIRHNYQQTFTHILIDEYQDTNTAQLELTKLLLNERHNLFVVGDFSQAIYSWRGADYRNMLTLQSLYPELKRYELSQNYRSSQYILDAASALIAQNTSHPVLSLWTENASGEKIALYEAPGDREEVTYVLKQIEGKLRRTEQETIAILYRTNAQSRAFEEGLLGAGIPYRLVGGVRFYARKEIKDLLAYLRLWLNPNDEVARARIEKLGKRKAALFFETYLAARETREKQSALAVLDDIIEYTQYLSLYDEHDEEDRERLENIAELRSVAAGYDDLVMFLETVALVEQEALRKVETADDRVRVLLMSIHAAKGLEFDHVFVVGMEEGMFPHSRSLLDRQQMEEERRLCYVALTRARQTLGLTFARRRLLYGAISGTVVSRFIAEIPGSIIRREGSGSEGLDRQLQRYTQYRDSSSRSKTRFVPFDDPSIDDFLSGSLDVSSFLNS